MKINFCLIRDLEPHKCAVLLKSLENDFFTKRVVLKEKDFINLRFNYIKWIKQDPDPQRRVAPFEYTDKNGLPDFDLMDKLIEQRKTKEEKKRERDEEQSLKDMCKKLGLEYWGPLREE